MLMLEHFIYVFNIRVSMMTKFLGQAIEISDKFIRMQIVTMAY